MQNGDTGYNDVERALVNRKHNNG